MSDNVLTYGISIYVEDSGKTYHTLNDWGLALGNNNYIGDPEMETTYIQVPGRDGLIDASEAVSGRRVYTRRELAFELGGIRERLTWDGVISSMRNNVHGRVCRLTIDNDESYFWRGRVFITGFDRFRELGKFTLSVPNADPYKYDALSSTDPWLWDPFNFETGVITQTGSETIVGSGSITIPHGHMLTCPDIVVSDKVSSQFFVEFEGSTYELSTGSNRIPAIMIGGEQQAVLNFTGSATVQISYRGGSL